ncbi:hypothetical protein HRI_002978200 [Hibiscus trionum]|uniref:DUF4283 domain-containing protein n=1 Tax=Hibiscus trionum TaxID=183268 RepID=A0A9W7I9Q9_HIBTR|nr:hypothetical protein HRI_002978200 [Hibiscus trionum]
MYDMVENIENQNPNVTSRVTPGSFVFEDSGGRPPGDGRHALSEKLGSTPMVDSGLQAPVISMTGALERLGSPLPQSAQRDGKRLKEGMTDVLDQGEGCGDGASAGDGQGIMKMVENPTFEEVGLGGEAGPMEGAEADVNEAEAMGSKRSYANILAGAGGRTFALIPGLTESEVVVHDDDVTFKEGGSYPVIRFSERVHDLIDRSMGRALIVHLLGRTISYRVLWNRLQSLWKLVGRFQLVDLENDYFLVKLEQEEDYLRILTTGPWTIFGSYLTVQPWSREFSTDKAHPSHVVVWVRLSGLPIRYYTKSLFRRITDIIGKGY